MPFIFWLFIEPVNVRGLSSADIRQKKHRKIRQTPRKSIFSPVAIQTPKNDENTPVHTNTPPLDDSIPKELVLSVDEIS